MVDRYEEPLHLRCQGLVSEVPSTTDVAHTTAATSSPATRPRPHGGQTTNTGEFTIGGLFSLLHMQPFDAHMKQKISTGLLAQLVIPDTVAFRPGDPMYPCWYLTSKAEPGIIKRKNSYNVTPRNIVEAFTRRRKRGVHKGLSGIIAVLVSDALPNAGITEEDDVGEAHVEYLDEVGLRHFLDRRVVSFSGILQQWVDPKGNHNSQLHCIWAQALCQVTCKTNVRALSDRRCSMYERAVTFDGAESHTQRDPVSAQTHTCIERLCANIARHVEQMTEGQCRISTFSSYLKTRPDGRLVLLWCSSLKTALPRTKTDAQPSLALLPSRAFSPVLCVPHDVDVMPLRHVRDKPYVCPISNKVCAANDAQHFVTYKMIIAEWDALNQSSSVRPRPSSAGFRPTSAHTPRQPPPSDLPPSKARPSSARTLRESVGQAGASDAARLKIPPIIQKLERLSDEALYTRLLCDASFIYKKVRVCEDVVRRFDKYVLSAADLDKELGDAGSRATPVTMVPNIEVHPPWSKVRGTASPFIDIMGDDADTHVPTLPLSRLHVPSGSPSLSPSRGTDAEPLSRRSSSGTARARAALSRIDSSRLNERARLSARGAGDETGSPSRRSSGVSSMDAYANSKGSARHLKNSSVDKTEHIAARAKEAVQLHSKRLQAAGTRQTILAAQYSAVQGKPPAPPPKAAGASTGGHLIAEGRRKHSVVAGTSLKALVPPQLRGVNNRHMTARTEAFDMSAAMAHKIQHTSEMNMRGRTEQWDTAQRGRMVDQAEQHTLEMKAHMALDGPWRDSNEQEDEEDEEQEDEEQEDEEGGTKARAGHGGGRQEMLMMERVVQSGAVMLGAALVRAPASGGEEIQARKVKRLVDELQEHVHAHSEHTRTVHELMEQARQQLALPPLTSARSQGSRAGIARHVQRKTQGCDEVAYVRARLQEGKAFVHALTHQHVGEDAMRHQASPRPMDWRGAGEGVQAAHEARDMHQMQGRGEHEEEEGGKWEGQGEDEDEEGEEEDWSSAADEEEEEQWEEEEDQHKGHEGHEDLQVMEERQVLRRIENIQAEAREGVQRQEQYNKKQTARQDVRDQVLESLLEGLDDREAGYFKQVIEQSGL